MRGEIPTAGRVTGSGSGQAVPPEDEPYRAYLRGRWPARTRLLCAYAFFGNLVFFLFDRLVTLDRDSPPTLAELARVRLPWLVIPVLGWIVARRGAASSGLPLASAALSLTFIWGTSASYLALGLGGSVTHGMALLGCTITAATFMPLTLRQRLVVFALIALGVVGLDLAWPQARSLYQRLVGDLAVLAVVAVEAVVFENAARSQRRGLALRRELEASVEALRASEARAVEAAAGVARLAAAVAHEVNSPLAAVKANLSWLGGGGLEAAREERSEVVQDTLQAVDRIARTMLDLGQRARVPVTRLGRDEGETPPPVPPGTQGRGPADPP